MNALLGHHLEPLHIPVLLAIFVAGFWIGWNLISRWLAHKQPL